MPLRAGGWCQPVTALGLGQRVTTKGHYAGDNMCDSDEQVTQQRDRSIDER